MRRIAIAKSFGRRRLSSPGARRARGYTIVELMMALTVLAIGVTGIVSMQKVTVTANQHAKRLALATHIAQAWQDQLAADATQWNHPSPQNPVPDLSDTAWLDQVDQKAGAWFRPAYDSALRFGAMFDALGNVTNNATEAQFCTHLRLTRLYSETNGNGLIRTEVRVFWQRGGEAHVTDSPFCTENDEGAAEIGRAVENYHFVYNTSAVRQATAL